MSDANPVVALSPDVAKQPEWPKLIDIMGPGLITGASDDDPSGIATYSQAGAQFGYEMGWTLLLTYPLMCAIQQISAEIGRVTGRGLAGNLRRHYPTWLLYGVLALLIIANAINIGADLGAMAAAQKLLIEGPAAGLRSTVRGRHGSAGNICAIFSLRLGIEVADLVAICLCRHSVCGRRALGHCRMAYGGSAYLAFRRLRDRGGGDVRHDHQPLPVFLAGR
jgi:Natural resistance-associated macrophage protein